MESAMWTEEYWDIQRRAFWGVRRYFARRVTPLCSQCASLKPDATKHSFAFFEQRLRKEEVFLNDILNLLMGLAPQAVYRRLIATGFGERVQSDEIFRSLGTGYLKHFDVGASTTQPDFLALGTKHTFAIELKLSSKSDLRQILLYAALAALEERRSMVEKSHFLLMLTPPKRFDAVWKEGFESPASLMMALNEAAAQPDVVAPKQTGLFKTVDLPSVLPRFRIAHFSYPDFAHVLEDLRPQQQRSAGDEVLDKLLAGAASEFRAYGGTLQRHNHR